MTNRTFQRLFASRGARPANRRITEIKLRCLVVMLRGPLDYVPDVGWVSRSGVEHEPFNMHVVSWLGLHGYVSKGAKSASISRKGEIIAEEVAEFGIPDEFAFHDLEHEAA